MRSHAFAALGFLTLALVPACKKAEAPPPAAAEDVAAPSPPPAEPAAAAAEASPTAAPAAASPTAAPAAAPAVAEVMAPGVSFYFSLAESPDALKMQEGLCAEESKGDAAKQAACLAKVTAEGGREGIRFEKDGDQLIFVSFGPQGDGEEIYLRGPVTVVPGTPADTLTFKAAGPFKGMQAESMPPEKLAGLTMSVRALDATTVVMDAPPPKGRLLYRKKG